LVLGDDIPDVKDVKMQIQWHKFDVEVIRDPRGREIVHVHREEQTPSGIEWGEPRPCKFKGKRSTLPKV